MKSSNMQWVMLSLLALALPVAGGNIMISEIMYHPYSEQTSDEYIEIYNNSSYPTNLTGWRFTKGVAFTFPNVTLEAHGYFVVAADVDAFTSTHDLSNVAGNWVGRLADGGEKIELQDAGGHVVNSVSYAKNGDWGVRLQGAGEAKPIAITRNGSTATVSIQVNATSGDSFVMSGADQPEYNGYFSISSCNAALPGAVTSFTYPISGSPVSPATGRIIYRQITDALQLGWSWSSRANGFGSSMELINPDLPNDNGQNWAPSTTPDGTPGAANSVAQANIPPMIVNLQHYPPVPQSSTPVTITAQIIDEHNEGLTVNLFWRLDSSSVHPFQSTPMYDDGQHNDALAGDGIYGATLGAQTNNAIVEFYVQATDLEGNVRTYPAPALDPSGNPIQEANALYQVDDAAYTGTAPLYKIIMREVERAELQTFPNSSPWSDAGMNATFISIDGSGTEVRYLVEIRDRGAGTRQRQPCNYKISFPSDRPLNGVNSFNLNTQYTHSQMLGYMLSMQSGLACELGRLVQVRVNNVNRASPVAPQFGHYMELQATDGNYVKTHWPNDADGNLYRCQSWQHQTTLTYLGTNWVSYANPGYIKQSNQEENDYRDLFQLTATLTYTNDPYYVDAVRQIIDVDEWMCFMAVFQLTMSRETSLGTGVGDDYSMYRGYIDTRFKLLSHDWDTIMNEGDTTGGYTTDIFRMTSISALNRFMRHPAFVPIYYRELKRLCDTVFSLPQMNWTVDYTLGGIVPPATLQNIKTFASNRWYYVLSVIPTNLTAASSLSQSSGFYYTMSSSAALYGYANVIDTRSVLVNGQAATWSPVDGRWTSTVTGLRPGINRILVQSLNSNAVEFARTNIDVWYDDSSVTSVSGTVGGSNYWSAAAGPYSVTGSLIIGNGAAVVIEPGASVYVASGGSITVNGSGVMRAEGTELQHIRFTRVPNGGNWGSLDFIGATTESRLAYVDIDYCGGTTISGHNAEIHVNGGSKVFFDHLTFVSTPVVEYISFDGSSFIVQNCYFPSYPGPTGPEMVHGINGIPSGGYGIFRDNYFGHTWGYNDTIDFTGGNRPGPILQFINNVFDGASDDHLDLDSTDAWIEGNIFTHAHRDPTRTDDYRDTASAISGGTDFAGQYSEWTVINNLFYDVDHALLNKQGGRFIFVNNTLVHVAKEYGAGLTNDIGAFDFTDNGLALPDPSLGAGAYVAGNIIWDCPRLAVNYNPNNQTVIFEDNLLPMEWTGPGTNNVVADPLLNLGLISIPTNADWRTVKAALTPRGGSPALGTGIGGFDKGGMNPPGLLIYGEPPSLTQTNVAVLTVAPGGSFNWGTVVPPYAWGYTNYKWKLDDRPWSAELSIAASPTITLSNLEKGSHTVYVTGKNDAGYYQDDPFAYPTNGGIAAHVTASRTWTITTNVNGLRINEILANNKTSVPHGEGYPDLVELYNETGTNVDLSGMGMTDDINARYKYVFPAGTILTNLTYLVLYADNPDGTPGLHLRFNLNKEGGGVYLFGNAAAGSALVDSITYGLQIADYSLGRVGPDAHWALTKPTFGSANIAAPAGDGSRLRINEWLASETYSYADDFLEIYNPDPVPAAIGGLYLTDNLLGLPNKHQVAALSFMPASGYFTFTADGNSAAGNDHLNFRINAERGELALLDRGLSVIDYVLYGPQYADISQGRSPSGGNSYAWFSTPTPGAANPGTAGTCQVSNIAVNLLPLTYSWKYDNFENLDGYNWMGTNYDDSIWAGPSPALIAYNEDNSQITPLINTYAYSYRITYYFRTTFILSNDLTGYNVAASLRVDDGAAIYVNGNEITSRIRLNPVTLYYTTYATGNPSSGDATGFDVVNIPASYFHPGTNTIAAEVHQTSSGSGDMVWGMQLDATRTVTNCLQISVVLNEILAHSTLPIDTNGLITDWVELYNPAATAVDLSGMSLTDNPNNPARWVFPAGVTLAPNSYLVVHCNNSEPVSLTNGAVLNTGFGLKQEGGRLLLFDAASRGGAQLDAVTFGYQATDYTIGRLPVGIGSWVLNVPTPGGANIAASLGDLRFVKVNEWMAQDNNGPDWFELYNPNAQPVNISGLFLTDDLNQRTQCKIPPLSFIGVGDYGFAKFIADNDSGPNHVCFKLAVEGESIGLFPTNGPAIDAISYGPQEQNISEGRFPDGSATIMRFPGTSTPGEGNLLPLYDIVINEVLSHSDPPFEDAIELQNVSLRSIDLSGWYLTDNKGDPKRFRIPPGTMLQPGEFVVFYEYQFNADGLARPPYFALNGGKGDDLYLFPADAAGNLLGYRTGVKFGAAESGVSIGRYDTSIDTDFVRLMHRTFGADNPTTTEQFRTGSGLTNEYPIVGPIVINEIMYHPPEQGTNDSDDYEYLELRNITTQTVPMYHPNDPTNTWRIRDGVDFDFPTNITIPGNGFLLVVGFDPATETNILADFRTRYGLSSDVVILGPYKGKLANGGERVELYKPDFPEPDTGKVPYVLLERIAYSDSAPWPSAADGKTNGMWISLQRRYGELYGNDPVNWYAGLATPAQPNGPAVGTLPGIISVTPSHLAMAGTDEVLSVTATGDAPLLTQWYLNSRLIPNETNLSLSLSNIQAEDAGNYSVVVANTNGAVAARILLQVAQPPVIVGQPQSQVAALGGIAVFSVSVLGSPPLSYQWQRGETNLVGATGAQLVLTNVQESDEGSYRVVVTNQYGNAISAYAGLSLSALPVLVSQPQNTNAYVGETIVFEVIAVGTPPLKYQWRFNGNNIGNATNSTLTLSNIRLQDAGTYTVLVQNMVGSVLSSPAVLTVAVPAVVNVIASDPAASEPGSDTGMFTISRSGNLSQPLTISFNVNGTATPGSDYIALPTSVDLPAGVTSTNILVTVLDDLVPEGDKTVTIALTPGVGYVLGSPANATVTIYDNDNLAPSVILTSPTGGSLYNVPAMVDLAADAVDPDGTIAKVAFYSNGTNKLGEVTSAPWAMVWTNVNWGTNLITAVAWDNLGSSAVSPPATVIMNGMPVVSITGPPNNASFYTPANIVITASASDPDGTISQVEFYAGTDLLGIRTTTPYAFAYTNVPVGSYALTVRAIDNREAVSTSAVVNISVAVPPLGFRDNFADRAIVSGFTNYFTGSNTVWTKEPGERNHANAQGGHSGWLDWLAPASGPCVMQTITTGLSGVVNTFDTVLAVYTGDDFLNLALVASNDDMTNSPSLQSYLAFSAVAGTTYHIAIDGFSSYNTGNFYFRMNLPNPLPIIMVQPQSTNINQGAPVILSVSVSGPAPFTYQWQFNEVDLANAHNNLYIIASAQPSQAGSYRVIVSNPSGSVTSNPAILTINTRPVITLEPQDQVADPGGTATFTGLAESTAPIVYQWLLNDLAIPGATNATCLISNIYYTNAGLYTLRATNQAGIALSSPAELKVRPRFVGSQFFAEEAIALNYEGVVGKSYSIDVSSTLTNWGSIGVISNSAILMQLQQTNSCTPNGVPRVYRLRQLP